VNPDSGPTGGMGEVYGDAVRRLRRSGVLVYGYVDIGYGATSIRRVVAAVSAYRRRLGLDGAFLDQAPAAGVALGRFARLAAALRATGLRVAINPGQPQFDPAALRRFDEVVAFEGDWRTYRAARRDLAAYPSSTRVWHLVYGTPAAVIPAVVAQARELGAGVIYATELGLPNPWRTLPAGWSTLVGSTSAPVPLPRSLVTLPPRLAEGV
jgi:hypothetical protein